MDLGISSAGDCLLAEFCGVADFPAAEIATTEITRRMTRRNLISCSCIRCEYPRFKRGLRVSSTFERNCQSEPESCSSALHHWLALPAVAAHISRRTWLAVVWHGRGHRVQNCHRPKPANYL